MTPRELHSFDWSGAGRHDRRLGAIARCVGAPGGVPALARGWSRRAVLEELAGLAARAPAEGTILVGMDFSFSFPRARAGAQFPDGSADRAGFWRTVHARVWPADARAYVEAFPARFLWWDQRAGRQHTGSEYVAARRRCEALAGAGTVFKLVGSGQVGKGSLCGIALLEALRLRCLERSLPLTIWPLLSLSPGGEEAAPPGPLSAVPDGRLVIVETYPSHCWARAGFTGRRPWDDPAAWARVRARLGAAAPASPPATGDEGDALVAWCSLASPEARGRVPEAPDDELREEGWIFGV